LKTRVCLLLAVLVIIILALVACSSPTTPPPSSSAPASKPPVTTAPPPVTAPPSSAAPTASVLVPPTLRPTASEATAGTQKSGGTLRLILASSPLFLGDPALGVDVSSIYSYIPSIEALVNSDNSGKMNGVLATAWTVAPDGKSIVFNLRKGVKFHDGTDFNAAAAKWNMDRFMTANKGTVPLWTGIDVVDDYTIKLNLKSFQNTILNDLESVAGMQVSPTAGQKNGVDWMKLNEAGTGPFTLKSFSRDVNEQYTRFDGYWGGKAFLDGISIQFIADANTARAALESGAADVFNSNTDAIVFDLVKKGYKLENRPGPLMVLVPDSKHDTSPLSKPGVRQAISYAIDRDSMAKSLGYGYWEVENQLSASYQFSHLDASQVPYKYDPTKAKQLLTAAGYPNGFTTSIIYTTTFGNSDPLMAIQSNLKDIGITANINLLQFAAWNDVVLKGWDNGMVWAVQGATDTNYAAFLNRYYSATATRYPVLAKPAGLTDLIDQALTTADYATEKSLCQKALKLLTDDCTTVPTYISSANYVMQKYVMDTKFSNLGGAGFRWSPQTAWLNK
jgi:peptide/nickel transport system substrate-binding protein